jgi:hypothetical protein
MPAAPSLEALFDTQSIFETAVAAYLTANGLTAYTTRGDDNLPDARIIVYCEPGASTGHQATRTTTNTGGNELDWFSVGLSFAVQTERAKDTASPDEAIASRHNYWVARLKVLMLRGAINGTITGITALTIPYHRIVVEAFAGETTDVTDETFDETVLSYQIQTQILADAWPE